MCEHVFDLWNVNGYSTMEPILRYWSWHTEVQQHELLVVVCCKGHPHMITCRRTYIISPMAPFLPLLTDRTIHSVLYAQCEQYELHTPNTHTYMYVYTHMQTYTDTNTPHTPHTCTLTQYTHTHAHMHTHTHTYVHIHTHICTHTRAHMPPGQTMQLPKTD